MRCFSDVRPRERLTKIWKKDTLPVWTQNLWATKTPGRTPKGSKEKINKANLAIILISAATA